MRDRNKRSGIWRLLNSSSLSCSARVGGVDEQVAVANLESPWCGRVGQVMTTALRMQGARRYSRKLVNFDPSLW